MLLTGYEYNIFFQHNSLLLKSWCNFFLNSDQNIIF